MKFLLLVVVLISLEQHGRAIDILDDRCLTDSSCGTTEYCDRDFPNPFGRCKPGYAADATCLFDRHCASKNCSFFKCKARILIKNGPCKVNKEPPIGILFLF
jgi:hypothetical protein